MGVLDPVRGAKLPGDRKRVGAGFRGESQKIAVLQGIVGPEDPKVLPCRELLDFAP